MNANVSIEIESDCEVDNTKNADVDTKQKSNRKTYSWSKVESYSTITDAHNSVLTAGFKKHGVKNSNSGHTTNYFCGKLKQKARTQCPKKMRIIQKSWAKDFVVEINNAEHTCTEMNDELLAKSISDEMAKMIVQCKSKRMAAKHIAEHIDSLREDHNLFSNERTPSRVQIYYILKKNKCDKILYLGELIEWCENHMEKPDDVDQPFVIGFECSEDVTKPVSFRLVVSTMRMLEHCTKVTCLCVDATYKLVWQDYPFMVIGTVDKQKKFHALCFALCVQETKDDFSFIFDTLKSNIGKHFGQEFIPNTLISDAADAIRNAFMESFPFALLMIMCYVHVLRNIEKNRHKYAKENHDEIFKDLNTLHLSSSPELFLTLKRLFLKKWMEREPEFAKYMNEQWFDKHCNWYEGAATYTPSTNNSIEGL